jgi:hypothetical protein
MTAPLAMKLCGVLSLFLCGGLGCGRPNPVAGIYSFDSSQVHERIETKKDGTFVQTIGFRDVTNGLTGTWQFSGNSVTFRGFLVRHDTQRDRLLNPANAYSVYVGFRDSQRDRIYFDVENEGKYFVTRVSTR